MADPKMSVLYVPSPPTRRLIEGWIEREGWEVAQKRLWLKRGDLEDFLEGRQQSFVVAVFVRAGIAFFHEQERAQRSTQKKSTQKKSTQKKSTQKKSTQKKSTRGR